MLITRNNLAILFSAIFVMATGNISLIHKLLTLYPPAHGDFLFLISVVLFFFILTALPFLWLCQGKASKWILAALIMLVSLNAYFMDSFGIVIDTVMIENILQTNMHEAAGLMNPGLLTRVAVFGLIPALIIVRYAPTPGPFRAELRSKLALSMVLIVALGVIIAPFSAKFTSFIREHKAARYYANPNYPAYSLVKYLKQIETSIAVGEKIPTASDAAFVEPHEAHELIIMVVGETARADRFSLNGYQRLTNPALAAEGVISLHNVTSCGTSTSVSVPCMFSALKREHFNAGKALHYENALEVLAEHGVQVLWRDNNSDSKGVALKLPYQNFRSPNANPACDSECRDVGMLGGLDKYIASQKDKDILIVLHQLGNHGPDYYHRYPKEFERFSPVCKNNDLGTCSQQEIDNAYDNAILYTDYFLAQVIRFLKKYDDRYETAMLYVGDHGESLGEHGLYLHAAPYAIAPREQTHVPAIVWMGKHFDFQLAQLKPYADYPLSHDDVFCTLLIAYELKSKTCEGHNQLLLHNRDIQASLQSSYAANVGHGTNN